MTTLGSCRDIVGVISDVVRISSKATWLSVVMKHFVVNHPPPSLRTTPVCRRRTSPPTTSVGAPLHQSSRPSQSHAATTSYQVFVAVYGTGICFGSGLTICALAMENSEKVVAVIMVGGPTKGTRFRPLSFNIPKPLFPLAGQPMVHHPISACKKIPNLAQIFLLGFYEEREFALYVSSISNELKLPVRYLKEDKPHGSAGGLYYFRDIIMEDCPSHIFLLNCDVCCSFPLPSMLDAHKRYGGMGTMLVSAESANQFGELVSDPTTNELLHYTEKPETFVSDLINCGVYVFTPDIFTAIHDVYINQEGRANLRRVSNFETFQSATRTIPVDFVRLDQDILSPLAGKKQLYTYETTDFWEQIKTPGMSLKCSELYLAQFRYTSLDLLASGDGKKKATIVGDVYIHPSAKVHPSAKLGPNVSISANVRVGAGVRLSSCIILDDVEIKADGNYDSKLGTTILGKCKAYIVRLLHQSVAKIRLKQTV
ncbi:hypothetical protein JHK84_052434 [Glycine max]|nr:hypothetical protein JHK84_052434 [Glycine max]